MPLIVADFQKPPGFGKHELDTPTLALKSSIWSWTSMQERTIREKSKLKQSRWFCCMTDSKFRRLVYKYSIVAPQKIKKKRWLNN